MTNHGLFVRNMAALSEHFEHALEDRQLKIYWEAFAPWTDEVMQKVFDYIMITFVPTSKHPFPVSAVFLDKAREIEKRLSIDRAQGEDRKKRLRLAAGKSNELREGKEGFQFCILNGHGEMAMRKCLDMEAKYPGKGWDEASEAWRDHGGKKHGNLIDKEPFKMGE